MRRINDFVINNSIIKEHTYYQARLTITGESRWKTYEIYEDGIIKLAGAFINGRETNQYTFYRNGDVYGIYNNKSNVTFREGCIINRLCIYGLGEWHYDENGKFIHAYTV